MSSCIRLDWLALWKESFLVTSLYLPKSPSLAAANLCKFMWQYVEYKISCLNYIAVKPMMGTLGILTFLLISASMWSPCWSGRVSFAYRMPHPNKGIRSTIIIDQVRHKWNMNQNKWNKVAVLKLIESIFLLKECHLLTEKAVNTWWEGLLPDFFPMVWPVHDSNQIARAAHK
jgi:hypothetical protein